MRTTFRAAAAVAVLVVALGAAGCAVAPAAPGTPAPTSTPLFASDEEALAAAEEAYGAYQIVEDQILAEGGAQGERIRPYAVREALLAANEGFEAYEAKGYRSIGNTAFEFSGLQSTALLGNIQEDVVVAYVCLDFSNLDVVNANGDSVVREGRPLRQEFQVSFDQSSNGESIVLASRDPWTGHDKCAS